MLLGGLDRTYDGFFETPTAVIHNDRLTSTPVIFGTEPIVRFSLLGRQRSISGSTRGRLNPGRLNSPINTPGPRLSALPS
jgi:hypothetical protein